MNYVRRPLVHRGLAMHACAWSSVPALAIEFLGYLPHPMGAVCAFFPAATALIIGCLIGDDPGLTYRSYLGSYRKQP